MGLNPSVSVNSIRSPLTHFLVPDGFVMYEHHACTKDGRLAEFSTRTAAEAGCRDVTGCAAIYDQNCDGKGSWWTCAAESLDYGHAHCVYERSDFSLGGGRYNVGGCPRYTSESNRDNPQTDNVDGCQCIAAGDEPSPWTQCSEGNPCPDDSFCDFSIDGPSGRCKVCWLCDDTCDECSLTSFGEEQCESACSFDSTSQDMDVANGTSNAMRNSSSGDSHGRRLKSSANECTPTSIPNSNLKAAGSLTGTVGHEEEVQCDDKHQGGGPWICGEDGAFAGTSCTLYNTIVDCLYEPTNANFDRFYVFDRNQNLNHVEPEGNMAHRRLAATVHGGRDLYEKWDIKSESTIFKCFIDTEEDETVTMDEKLFSAIRPRGYFEHLGNMKPAFYGALSHYCACRDC
jgi:hypothetical protein